MAALVVSRDDQERLKDLLSEAVTVLCRNGLKYTNHVTIDGLLGITVDSSDVFLVKLTETVRKTDAGPDLSRVSELLGAAQGNFGVLNKLAADGSTPLPLTRYSLGAKDLNDNHQPHAINITPVPGDLTEALNAARRDGKRMRARTHSVDAPQPKRTHVIEPQPTSGSKAAASSGWQIQKDDENNLVIKAEPMDPDEDTGQQPLHHYKTLGVISAVPTDRDVDSDDNDSHDGFPEGQPETQDGVLQALRTALMHKLANNGTPPTKPHTTNNLNNNNNSPCMTPPTSNGNGNVKKRKITPKAEKEEESVTLKCLMCTYETNRRYNFIRHMRGHSKSYAIYACDLCGDRFHSEDELGAHGLEAHKGHHLTCDQCGMTFMSERGKNIHAKTHKMMPIPEKKTVECETQCSTNDLEMSLSSMDPAICQKVMSSTVHPPEDSDESTTRYRTLREQLSSRNLVLRFPVLNGQVQKPGTASTGVGSEDMEEGEDSGSASDQPDDLSMSKPDDLSMLKPDDLSMSKSCLTSALPPPTHSDKPLNLQLKRTRSLSSTSAETPTTEPAQATTSASTTTKASITSGASTFTAAAGSMTLATKPAPFAITTVTAATTTTTTKPASFTAALSTKSGSFTAVTAATTIADKPLSPPFTISTAKHLTPSSIMITRQSSSTTAVAKPASSMSSQGTAGVNKQVLQTIVKPGVTIITSKPVATAKTTTAAAASVVKPGVSQSLYTSILPRQTALATSAATTFKPIPTPNPSPSTIRPPTTSNSPAPETGDSKPKEKSRKQRSAQIIRLVMVKPEPLDS